MTPLAFAAAVAALSASATSAAPCVADRVNLVWTGGGATFHVEIADTTAERSRGLMFRDHLPPDAGMVFVYDQPQTVAFWMKNTRIPLDMLFIAADGHVVRIAAMAQPLDETPIPSGGPVRFVLEVGGGRVARLGIRPGAVMQSPLVDPGEAALPCPTP